MESQTNRRFYIVTGLAGLLLRLVVMPFALHVDPNFGGDLLTLNWEAHSLLQDPRFGTPYPPLALYTIGAFQALWRLPLSLPVPVEPMLDVQTFLAPHFFYQLFATKALYLLFDLLCLLFLVRLYRDNPRQHRMVWLFWVFNPLVIYDAYVHGQYDLIPVFFVILGLYAANLDKPRWAALALGIGACYKVFPLFFLLPLVIVCAKSWRDRLVLLLLGAAPYLLLSIPFLAQWSGSLGSYPDWYLRGSYDLGFGSEVYIFLVFYGALLWYLYDCRASTFQDLWRASFAVLLVYYQFSYFDLHYWVWIVPFAAIYWAEHRSQARPFYIVVLLCLLVLTAPTPLARFLAPISPRFFLRLPSLMEALNPYLPVLLITNIVRSVLAGTCFYLAWRLPRDVPASRNRASLATPSAATGPVEPGPGPTGG